MPTDLHDQLSNLVYSIAGITARLLKIQSEPPPPAEDTAARLRFAVDQLGRYRAGVSELHVIVDERFAAILSAGDAGPQ